MVVDVGSPGYRLYVSVCTHSLAASTREIASNLKPFLGTLREESHGNRAYGKAPQ